MNRRKKPSRGAWRACYFLTHTALPQEINRRSMYDKDMEQANPKKQNLPAP